MTFHHARGGDADEPAVPAIRVEVRTTAVPHRTAESAHQLIDEVAETPAIRDHPFNSFWNELPGIGGLPLPVAIRTAGRHRAFAAHAPIGLESPSSMNDQFARALIHAGEEASEHHGIGTGRDRLGDVAGLPDATVCDDRDTAFLAD